MVEPKADFPCFSVVFPFRIPTLGASLHTALMLAISIASVTTTGYAGILLGPAIIGFVSDATSLVTAFWLLALLILVVPLSALWVART